MPSPQRIWPRWSTTPADAVAAILLMSLATATIISGHETRVGRFEPDAVLLLVAHLGSLVGLAS